MANSIAFAKNYTGIIDEVYKCASVSGCLTSGERMVRAGRAAKEIVIPEIEVTGLGDYIPSIAAAVIVWTNASQAPLLLAKQKIYAQSKYAPQQMAHLEEAIHDVQELDY